MSPTRSVRTSFAARQERKNSIAVVTRRLSEDDKPIDESVTALDLHPSAVRYLNILKIKQK